MEAQRRPGQGPRGVQNFGVLMIVLAHVRPCCLLSVGIILAGGLAAGPIAGCAPVRYENTAAFIEHPIRARHDKTSTLTFKACVLVPARDVLTLDPLWRVIFGDPAWNVADGRVADSSFWTQRTPTQLEPRRVAAGPCTMVAPQPPFRVRKLRRGGGGKLSFIGTDARGRTFFFKPDDPEYPELGTTATIVGARILWALGYRVPPIYLVRIEGTGDPRLDGRRATAALFLDNVLGHFHFDWFRYRREVRALRVASAWINDTDRLGNNTLVVRRAGRAAYYLIDFDSCLGAWQGRPKEPWRGFRRQWCPRFPPRPVPEVPIVSPALGRLAGRFDPAAWQPQALNNAFEHMTAADAAWMAAQIRRLGRPQLEAIVAQAHLSDPADATRLVEILLSRRAAILERYAPGDGAARDSSPSATSNSR